MENRDEKLWLLAKQRAKFKGNVISYVAVNIFLWAIWFLTSRNNEHLYGGFIPWPAWVSIGWGFGLVINYVKVYHMNGDDAIQKEYDKLKNRAS
jgi:hypothetical protein